MKPELMVGDVVSNPGGFMDWPKWEHRIWKISGDMVHTVFDNGNLDSKERHANSVLRSSDWMSIENMNSCLEQPDTVVHRNGVQIWPEVQG